MAKRGTHLYRFYRGHGRAQVATLAQEYMTPAQARERSIDGIWVRVSKGR